MKTLYCAVLLFVAFAAFAAPTPGLSHVHRGGGAKDRPDNTLETFKWAWANGAGVECDCRFTKDRVPIMLHDGNLRRTGRAAPGDERLLTNAVSQLTFEEVRRVDVGRYLAPEFAGERVPSLDEVFAAMTGHPTYTIFVDDKGIGPKFLAERAVAAGLLDQVFYTTCSYGAIANWHALTGGKGKSRLWLGPGTRQHDAASVSQGEARCDRMLAEARKGGWKGVTIICIDVNYDAKAAEPFVPSEAYLRRLGDELREHGVGFTAIPYQGGDSAEVYHKLVDIGVDGLCTDYPKVLFASGVLPAPPVDISLGRQLFIDDSLIESAVGVSRCWNKPSKMEDPVVWPGDGAAPKSADGSSLAKEGDGVNLTCASDGGLWWDPSRRKFRLWYQADWLGDICYAESADGLKWEYPDLGIVPGSNRIFEYDEIDSWCVVPNYAAMNPYADWKLYISPPGRHLDTLWESPDGIHFSPLGKSGCSDDRSTCYFDPFRGEWVFSLRDGWPGIGRARRRFASRTFGGEACRWSWPGFRDESYQGLAEPEKWLVATNGVRRQLYSFDAVAYESVMLGVMEILYNTPGDNGDCEKVGLPKQTGLHFCFSRDGRKFEPRTDADIAPEGWNSGKWDTGYLSCIGGICVIKDERLWFYYSGLRGDGERLSGGKDWPRNGMYSNGSIGIATLRRDGFAGMVADARGELLTKPVLFSGSRLFVNAECRFGSLVAEVVDMEGRAIPGFSFADCAAFRHSDATKAELRFRGGDLSALAGRAVRFRFRLHCGTLYSFWVSPSAGGESLGYVAAGGPDYPGLRDLNQVPR